LSSSETFLSLLSKYLTTPFRFSNSTILALQDCYLLGGISKDFFSRTLKSINSTNTLSSSEAEELLILLSATVTCQDTCLNSLKETTPNPTSDVLEYLSNGTKLYSISLAFFKRGWWKPKRNTERKLDTMWEQKLYELIRRRGRELLKVGADDVVVNGTVVVNPDGYGDYKTINDAVAAAPSNLQGNDGFFVIHVVGGVYEEYVSIPHDKRYLMMIGDGINQTIITGDHNKVDGWTTFSSATFGN